MSMPSFPPNGADMTQEEALTMIIASIAMEELALSHILNAEGEKLQYSRAGVEAHFHEPRHFGIVQAELHTVVIDHAVGVVRSAENVVQRYIKVVGVFQKNLRGGRGIVDLVPGESGLGNVKFLCQLCLREPDAFAQAPEPFTDDFQVCVTSFSVSSIPRNRECVNDIFT